MINNYYQNPFQYPKMQQNSITWVQGIEGAKAFQLSPNSNAVLMDSEDDRFFIKSADNVGMCTLRAFKYEELTDFGKPKESVADLSQFVTKDEFNKFIESMRRNANEQSVSGNASKQIHNESAAKNSH